MSNVYALCLGNSLCCVSVEKCSGNFFIKDYNCAELNWSRTPCLGWTRELWLSVRVSSALHAKPKPCMQNQSLVKISYSVDLLYSYAAYPSTFPRITWPQFFAIFPFKLTLVVIQFYGPRTVASFRSDWSTRKGKATHCSLEHIQGNVLVDLAVLKEILNMAGATCEDALYHPTFFRSIKKKISIASCICKSWFKIYKILRFFFPFLFACCATVQCTVPCHLIPFLSQPYSWA